MAVKIQEGFALFSRRMDAKTYIEGEDESLDNMESQKILEINKERDERKRKLLFDNPAFVRLLENALRWTLAEE